MPRGDFTTLFAAIATSRYRGVVIKGVAAAVLAFGALTVADAPARDLPGLRLLDRSPLSLRGSHFAPRERVRVTVSGDASAARTIRTGAGGGFVVTFQTVSVT